MSATATVVASGAWTDFHAFTEQLITLSQVVPIGHRAIFCHTTTVDAGVAPNATGYTALVDPLFDTNGNTWTRDAFNVIDGVDTGVTTEVWSTFVGPTTDLPTNGFGLNCNVVRGVSSQWCLIDVSGLAESNGTSPLDNFIASNNVNVTSWVSGSMTLAQSDEFVLGVYGGNPGVTLPGNPWFTDTAGFTSLHQQSNANDGSNQMFAVLSKEFVSGGSVQGTGTTASSKTGNGLIVAYKVGTPATVTLPSIQQVQHKSAQITVAATSEAVTLTNPTVVGNLLIVAATVWKSGGADPGATIADNKSNSWTAVETTAPSTSGGARAYIWYAKIATGGSSHQVTVTANAAAEISVSASEWSGTDPTTPLDLHNKATGSSASANGGSVTTSLANDLYFQLVTEDAGTTFANAQGWTKMDDIATGQDIHIQWQTKSSSQVANPTQTLTTSTTWAGIMATFKASATSPVSKTLTTSYNVKQQIAKTLSTSYTVKLAIAKTVAATYSVKQQIAKTKTATYNIIVRVAKVLTASYNVGAPPVNTVAPTISGSPLTGQLLTASTGTWSNSPTSFSYQWQVETAPGSGVYSDISGETASTLQL